MTKTSRAWYKLEFKQEAVKLVHGGQSIAAAARTLGVIEQTLFNWVKAQREGRLLGIDSKPVSAEHTPSYSATAARGPSRCSAGCLR